MPTGYIYPETMAGATIILCTRDSPSPSKDSSKFCINGTRLVDDLRNLKRASGRPRTAKNNTLWCACTKTKPNELCTYLIANFTPDWKTHCDEIDSTTKIVHVTPQLAKFLARFATAHDVADAIQKWVEGGCATRNPVLFVGRASAGKAAAAAKVNATRTAIQSTNAVVVADADADAAAKSSGLFADYTFNPNTIKSPTTESGRGRTERCTDSTDDGCNGSGAFADDTMVDVAECLSLDVKVRVVVCAEPI